MKIAYLHLDHFDSYVNWSNKTGETLKTYYEKYPHKFTVYDLDEFVFAFNTGEVSDESYITCIKE